MELNKLMSGIILGCSLFLIATISNANVITFDSLTGANGDAFSGTSENGFTVTSVLGDWKEAHLFGTPIPDIFAGSSTAAVEVTANSGGTFQFNSVDLGQAGGSGLGYSIEGYNGGTSVFTLNGLFGSTVEFNTILSSLNNTIDMLKITMIQNGSSSYNIDNINVSSTVPEPASILLLGTGLLGFAGVMRKKART